MTVNATILLNFKITDFASTFTCRYYDNYVCVCVYVHVCMCVYVLGDSQFVFV